MSETVRDDSGSSSDGGTGSGIGNGSGSGSAGAGEHLARLHSALAERHVPGLKLEPALALSGSDSPGSGSPTVYTAGTCTRVHAGCFLIHRVSGHGQVLETVSLGVGRQETAVALIAVMSGALTL